MSSYHLAQLNIAKMKYSVESAEMSEFVDNLNRINALADSAAGFVCDCKATMVMRQASVFLDRLR
jgi:hypothetical protein